VSRLSTIRYATAHRFGPRLR